jgi:hypothetical protein
MATISFELSPGKFLRWSLLIVAVLVLLSVAGRFVREILEIETTLLRRTVRLFQLNEEQNLPTWYSSALLLFCAAVSWAISVSEKLPKAPSATQWKILGLLFLAFSIDETATIHERFLDLLARTLEVHRVLSYEWLIPGIIIIVGITFWFVLFAARLPPGVRGLFIAGWVVFVSGLLLFETLAGYAHPLQTHRQKMLHILFTSVEELLEMVGVCLLGYSLLLYRQRLEEKSPGRARRP